MYKFKIGLDSKCEQGWQLLTQSMIQATSTLGFDMTTVGIGDRTLISDMIAI